MMAATRTANIVKNVEAGEVDPARFLEESERKLWAAYQAALPVAEKQVEAGDFAGLFATLEAMREPVDRFFEDVLVMAEDETVRANRLALVSAVNGLFMKMADFGVVVQG